MTKKKIPVGIGNMASCDRCWKCRQKKKIINCNIQFHDGLARTAFRKICRDCLAEEFV